MSTQARPLSFADQAFQNQKKKTKWQETFEKNGGGRALGTVHRNN